MPRADVDQSDVLTAVVSYLRTQLTLNETRCYEVIDPNEEPPFPISGDYWLQIALGSGQFDDSLMTGAVREQLCEWMTITVGMYTRVYLDQTGHAREMLIKAGRGIVRIKRMVLNAFAGADLTVGGSTFGRELWRPTFCTEAHHVATSGVEGAANAGGIEMLRMLLTFRCGFDWDLD